MTPPSTPKQPRLDEAASVFAVTTPKASASRGIASFLGSASSDDQDQLDNLLTKVNFFQFLFFQALITGNIAANFLDNPFFRQFIHKLRPSYKLPSRNEKFVNKLIPAEFERVHKAVEATTNGSDFLALSSDEWTDVCVA